MLEGKLILKTVFTVYIYCHILWLFPKYCALANVDLSILKIQKEGRYVGSVVDNCTNVVKY